MRHYPAAAMAGLAALTLACSDSSAPVSDPQVQADKLGSHGHRGPTLTPQNSGTTSRLQAISPVNQWVAWASGVNGTYTRTLDGGRTWTPGVVPGAETLQFRDVEGISAREAYLMSAGPGTDSRIYKTKDGGRTWTQQFENQDPNAFYDCFAFWSPDRGITFSDAVNGRFPVIRTTDGRTWQDIGDQLPAAQPGEAGFAASGTCVAVQGGRRAWIATGGAEKARILATTDGGRSWKAYETPIVQGTPSSGGFSVDFRDPFHGILGGGELASPDITSDNIARSRDGGRTWTLATPTPFTGAVYGLSYAKGNGAGSRTVVATGPAGAAWSPDEGGTWTRFPETTNYWAVAFANPRTGWLVGTEGRILKVSF